MNGDVVALDFRGVAMLGMFMIDWLDGDIAIERHMLKSCELGLGRHEQGNVVNLGRRPECLINARGARESQGDNILPEIVAAFDGGAELSALGNPMALSWADVEAYVTFNLGKGVDGSHFLHHVVSPVEPAFLTEPMGHDACHPGVAQSLEKSLGGNCG